MKYILFIVAVIGLSYGLQADLEYQYKYSASVATGIPELSSQASGVAVKGDLTVQVDKDGVAKIQLTNVELAEFNDKLGCDFRGDIPAAFKPVDNEYLAHMIEMPFEAHLFANDGVSLVVNEEEQPWMTNLGKGIVNFLRNEFLQANFHDGTGTNYAAYIHNGKIPHEFHVQEDTIFGSCKVEYTIHKLPGYIAARKSHMYEIRMKEDVQRESHSAALTSKKTTSKQPHKTSQKTPTKTTKTSHGAEPSKYVKKHQLIKDDLWHMVRTVNFDNCYENVALQTTPFGIRGKLGGSQYKYLRGRSSVSEYIVRGSGGAARIEAAVVEGATSMAPIGIKSENLEVRTNQTYQLVAVREIKKPFKMPAKTKEIKTWMYEVLTHTPKPTINEPNSWITYTNEFPSLPYIVSFGATPITNEDRKKLKEFVTQAIETVSKMLSDLDQEYNPSSGEIMDHLSQASYITQYLTKEDILDIFHKFAKKETHAHEVMATSLIIDVAAAAGTDEGIRAILAAIKEGKIPYHKIFTWSMTLTSNLESPETMPDIMDYVMSINIREQPFLAATVYLNFANLLREMCITPEAMNVQYPSAMFGDRTCNTVLIRERYVPFLKNILYNPDSRYWEKNIAIKTLGELGTPFVLPILRQIILGEVEADENGRAEAIFALDRSYLSEHYSVFRHLRNEIISMLTEVYSNIGEKTVVRQAALAMITTWSPDASFWHRLARTSWREPSRQMASYMTHLIEATAAMKQVDDREQSHAASHAATFAKPVVAGDRYSFAVMPVRKIAEQHIELIRLFEWIHSEQDPMYIDTYLTFYMELGGFEMTGLEFQLESDALAHILKLLENGVREEHSTSTSGIAAKVAKQYFEKIQETIKAKRNPSKKKTGTNIFLAVFEHMKTYLPINEETLRTLPVFDQTTIASIVVQLSLGYDYNLVKFVNPMSLKTFHASDIGLPVFASINNPLLVADSCVLTIAGIRNEPDVSKMLEKLEASFDCLTKLVSQATSSVAVFIPFSNSYVTTDITANREITLPLTMTTRMHDKKEGSARHVGYHLDFQSNYKNKFTILRADNTPSTSIVPMPLHPDARPSIVKPINPKPIKEDHFNDVFSRIFFGLDFEVTWASEVSSPFDLLDIIDIDFLESSPWLLYALASPTVRQWKLEVAFDPASSETKNISINYVSGTYGKPTEDFSQFTQETGEEFSQFTQEATDDDFSQQFTQDSGEIQTFSVKTDFQQVSQESGEDIDGSPEIETIGQGQFAFGDTLTQRSDKLQEKFGGEVNSNNFKIEFDGTHHRTYEILYTWSKSQATETRKLIKSQLAFFRGPVPLKDDKPFSICLDVQKAKSKFNPLDTLESLKTANLDTDLSAEVTVGCTGKPIISLKGTYHLSDEAKNQIFTELQTACDYDPYNQLLSFHRHAVYDQVQYSVGWEEMCDLVRMPILSVSFRFIEKLMGLALFNPTCNDNEPSRKITINADRCPVSHHWTLKARRDETEESVEFPEFDELLDELYTVKRHAHAEHKYPDHYTTHGIESKLCSIGIDSLRTFDGFTYTYEPSHCWSVAVKDCSSDTGAMLLIRSSQGESTIPELRYISDNQQNVIDIAKGLVKVNGKIIDLVGDSEIVKDDEGNYVCTVSKKDDYILVKFDKFYAISVKERVAIRLPESFMGHLCGLCGDYNGEPEGELIGPHKCYYGCQNIFKAAWTAGSETCDTYELLATREKAENYQKDCKTITSFYEESPKYSHYCTEYKWLVKTIGNNTCISETPIPYCDGDCVELASEGEEVSFRCWPTNNAPKTLKDALEQEDLIPTLIQTTGYSKESEAINLPYACRTF